MDLRDLLKCQLIYAHPEVFIDDKKVIHIRIMMMVVSSDEFVFLCLLVKHQTYKVLSIVDPDD